MIFNSMNMTKNIYKYFKNKGFMVVLALFLVCSLVCGDLDIVKINAESADESDLSQISNPIVVEDSTTRSGQRTTYSIITFGSYPQSEVLSDDEEYSKLENATDWDSANVTTIDGVKYKRITKSDARRVDWQVMDRFSGDGVCSYNWEDSTSWHYFRFEPIKWRVLEKSDDELLCLSELGLDTYDYWDSTDNNNNSGSRVYEKTEWLTSLIRYFLNSYDVENGFLDTAFSDDEQNAIVGNLVDEGVYDKIVLPDFDMIYSGSKSLSYGFCSSADAMDDARLCNASDYGRAMGIVVRNSKDYVNCCRWQTSERINGNQYMGYVDFDGKVIDKYNSDYSTLGCGIRPIIQIDTTKDNIEELIDYSYQCDTTTQIEKQILEYYSKVESEKDFFYLGNKRVCGSYYVEDTCFRYVNFGSFPKTEIKEDNAIYGTLSSEDASWSNNEIEIDGEKYLRLTKDEVNVFDSGGSHWYSYYDWSASDAEYRYIKYEPIKWCVVAVEDGKALLLSDECIYNWGITGDTSTSAKWSVSCLRSYLNGYTKDYNTKEIDFSNNSFVGKAFSEDEKDIIVGGTIDNDKYGLPSKDMVLIPCKDEIEDYSGATSGELYNTDNTDYSYILGSVKCFDKVYCPIRSTSNSIEVDDPFYGNFTPSIDAMCVRVCVCVNVSDTEKLSDVMTYEGLYNPTFGMLGANDEYPVEDISGEGSTSTPTATAVSTIKPTTTPTAKPTVTPTVSPTASVLPTAEVVSSASPVPTEEVDISESSSPVPNDDESEVTGSPDNTDGPSVSSSPSKDGDLSTESPEDDLSTESPTSSLSPASSASPSPTSSVSPSPTSSVSPSNTSSASSTPASSSISSTASSVSSGGASTASDTDETIIYKGIKYRIKGNKVVVCGISKKMVSVRIPEKIKYNKKSYKVTEVSANAFKGNRFICNVRVGDNVTKINECAFMKCKKLQNIIIGKSIVNIGTKAFANDKKLVFVKITSKRLKKVKKGAFDGISSKVTFRVPTSKLRAYQVIIKNSKR
ncbi:MAG: leucine-rich repeat domain-containing protein [Lachnospiraceae bacterium]|nr:leucine-rich repeat domain-containing protein [Lachnospiraceae bacterium]